MAQNPFTDPNYGAEPDSSKVAPKNPFSDPDYGAPDPGFATRLGQGASRALDSAKTALTDDPNKIAKIAADQARTALPQTPLQRQLADEFKPYVDAANKAEGFVDNVTAWGAAGFKRAGQLLSNPAEAGKMLAEQLPNSLPSLAGGFAGAKGGAALGTMLAGPVGTVPGAIVGGIAGGFAGGYGLEKGAAMQEQVQQEAQKRNIDIQNQGAVAGMVAENQSEFDATAQRKGVGTAGTDAILNVATMGLAGMGGRALAKEAQALGKAVQEGAISAADASNKIAALQAANAARNTVGAKAARGAGVVGAEMVGEGVSEAVGQKYAYGEVDAGQVIDESLMGLGTGGAMALGSKAFNKAAGIVDQDATTQTLAAAQAEIERRVAALPDHQQNAERARLNAQLQAETRMGGLADEEMGAPDMAQGNPSDYRATPAWAKPPENAAPDSASADDEIFQSTGAPQRVDPVREAVRQAADAGGALSAAAGMAMDSGAADQMAQAAQAAQAANESEQNKPQSADTQAPAAIDSGALETAAAAVKDAGDGAAPAQAGALQDLTPAEAARVASTLAGSDLAKASIDGANADELQAKLQEVQQRAADNGSWNVPLMAQRRRIEDAMARLQPVVQAEDAPQKNQPNQAQALDQQAHSATETVASAAAPLDTAAGQPPSVPAALPQEAASDPAQSATAQAQAAMDNVAAQIPSIQPHPNGAPHGPQADQAQQASAQPAQAGGPQAAAVVGARTGGAIPGETNGAVQPATRAGSDGSNTQGLINGAAQTQDHGVQAGAPTAPQAQAQEPSRQQLAQRIADAGQQWTRMPTAERQALAARTDVKPVLRKNLHGSQWENLNIDMQRKLATALGVDLSQPKPKAQKATEALSDQNSGAQAAPMVSIHAPFGANLEEVTPLPNEFYPPEGGGFKPEFVFDEFTTTKDAYGKSVTVRTADLEGDGQRLRTFTKAGKPRGVFVHREDLDQTGEKLAASAAQAAENPLFNVITKPDGTPFGTELAASRELNKRGLGASHEVVESGGNGFVVRKLAGPGATPKGEGPGAQAAPGSGLQDKAQGNRT